LTSPLHNLFLHSEPPLPVTLLPIGSCCFRAKSFSCINTPTVLSSSHTSYHLPMKMEQTECSEMSAYIIQTPGNYPKRKHNIFRTRRKFEIRGTILFEGAKVILISTSNQTYSCQKLACQYLHNYSSNIHFTPTKQ
jgi:hypothetical protein